MRVHNIALSSHGTEASDPCREFRRRLSNIRRTALVALVLTLASSTALSQNLSLGSREARPVPPWLQRSSIYELWLNAFSAEGNLRGAIPRLKQIADLGATIIYLGPIAKRSATPRLMGFAAMSVVASQSLFGSLPGRSWTRSIPR